MKKNSKKVQHTKLKFAGLAMCVALTAPAMLLGCSAEKDAKEKITGTKWFSGSEAPNNTNGVNGDFYLETEDFILYQKIDEVWVSLGSIKGADGVSSYTHIAYSANPDGSDFASTFNIDIHKYIGVGVSDSAVTPTDKTAYKWSLFKGENGLQGVPGTPARVHIAYADNPSGTEFVNSWSEGYKYLGIAVTTDSLAPTDKSAYSWSLMQGTDGSAGQNGKTSYVHIAYSADANGSDFSSTYIEQSHSYMGIAINFNETPPIQATDYKWLKIKGESGEDAQSERVYIRYSPTASGEDLSETCRSTDKYIGVCVTTNKTAPTDNKFYEWSLFKGENGVKVQDMKFAYRYDADGNKYLEVKTIFSDATEDVDILYGTESTIYVGNSMTMEKALEIVPENGTIMLKQDLDVNLTQKIDKSVTIDLGGKRIFNTNDVWEHNDETNLSLLQITNNADVILKNGTIEAKENDCYAIELNGGNLTIESGEYIGNISAVQVKLGHLEIDGGMFSVKQLSQYNDERYLINCIDANHTAGTASYIVNGGTFVNFNPAISYSESSTNPESFVANEKTVVSSKTNETEYFSVVSVEDAVEMLNLTAGEPVQMYLTQDLVLPQNGVEIGNDINLTIHLNGHSVTGWQGAAAQSVLDEQVVSAFRVKQGGKLKIIADVDLSEQNPTISVPVWSDGGEAVIQLTNNSNKEMFEVKLTKSDKAIVKLDFEVVSDNFGNSRLETTTTFKDNSVSSSPIVSINKLQSTIFVDGTNVTLQNAFDSIAENGTVKLVSDINLTKAVFATSKFTLDLAGYKIYNEEQNVIYGEKVWSLISARGSDANLTITSSKLNDDNSYGLVDAFAGDSFAVDAQGGATVTIEKGDFYGNITSVYAHSGNIIINGGNFDVKQLSSYNDKRYVLNCLDQNRLNGTASIVVNGGTFVEFDPTNTISEIPSNINFAKAGLVALKKIVTNNSEISSNYTVGTLEDMVNFANLQPQNLSLEGISAEYSIKLLSDEVVESALNIKCKITIDFNGYKITCPNDAVGDGVFHVVAGGNLSLIDSSSLQSGGIVSTSAFNDYSMAVWSDGGEVNIYGGNYSNVGATSMTDQSHFDLIYAKNGGKVNIYGGYFECETPNWTLNLNDSQPGTITVYGGSFINFNPQENTTENPAISYLANGYKVTSEQITIESIQKTKFNVVSEN